MVARKYSRRSRKKPVSKTTRKVVRYARKKISFRKRLQASGNSMVSRFVKYRAPSAYLKLMSKLCAADYLYNSYCTRLTTTFGYSSVTAVSMLGSGPFVSAAGGFDNELGQIQYRINGAASGDDPKKTCKYLVQQSKGQIRIVNQDNGPVQIVLYDVVAKRDCNVAPQVAFVNGLRHQGATAYTATTLPPGISPTQSLEFNTYFKVNNVRKMTLQQGRVHVHNIDLTPNYLFNAEKLEENNLNIAKLTHWVLIHVTGFVTNSVTNPNTEQTFGAAAIDIGMTKMTKYTFINDITSNTYLNTVPAVALTGGENTMNIGSGAPTIGAPA